MGEQVTLQEGYNQKFYLHTSSLLHQKVFCIFARMEKPWKTYQQCKLLLQKPQHSLPSSACFESKAAF